MRTLISTSKQGNTIVCKLSCLSSSQMRPGTCNPKALRITTSEVVLPLGQKELGTRVVVSFWVMRPGTRCSTARSPRRGRRRSASRWAPSPLSLLFWLLSILLILIVILLLLSLSSLVLSVSLLLVLLYVYVSRFARGASSGAWLLGPAGGVGGRQLYIILILILQWQY